MFTGVELGNAIRSAIATKGVTQTTVAEHFGVRQSSITDWLKRGTISKDKLPELWAYFSDVVGPEHWGLSGVAAVQSQWQHLGTQEHRVPYTDTPAASDFSEVRRVKFKLAAGASGFAIDYLPDDGAPIWFRREWFVRRGLKPAKVFAVDVSGASMEPNLYAGDTVVVNTEANEPRDGVVFAANYDGEPVIKRLMREGGQWWLASDNPNQTVYPRKLCDQYCKIVGEVVHRQTERI